MAVQVSQPGELMLGDVFEDCRFHPCLCVGVEEHGGVYGVSLVDGSGPQGCNIRHCGLRKLTVAEALHWKLHGPADVDLAAHERWWERSSS